ncbi:unnamed protein product [Vitrella brassicaformis CCMP3155]|uniref:TOG domain-containing protein n=2 Tax=Vitrella brassicaformis TaxID=1169539 RepID=A0A0G4FYK1_VITBC|nr:unnamed protein product [Vitrella brassicaformis CCMP3155]|mmetsp:Transcript_16976/g.40739  ORF Transcript_16976/g.40739 Transcript_16976/m.40739 type:complete len:1293 (+) Transcript_16976:176-4054(+)|eukprot:CEM20117.1 unnamed protein product [Vitrella brassicaformis CCMP3155]
MENGSDETRAKQQRGLVGLSDKPSGAFDQELYGGADALGQYVTELPTEEEAANLDRQQELTTLGGTAGRAPSRPQKFAFTAPKDVLNEVAQQDAPDPFAEHQKDKTIAGREDSYRSRWRQQMLSPERADPFASQTPGPETRSYTDVMKEQQLDKEKGELIRKIQQKKRDEDSRVDGEASGAAALPAPPKKDGEKKRRRWDQPAADEPRAKASKANGVGSRTHGASEWDISEASVEHSRWDTPVRGEVTMGDEGAGASSWDQAVVSAPKPSAAVLGETPTPGRWDETPAPGATPGRRRSRWDETPVGSSGMATPGPSATPGAMGMGMATPGATPFGGTPGATPLGMSGMMTPMTPLTSLTPDQLAAMRITREIDERNRPMTDEELEAIFPPEGYELVKPPASYQPLPRAKVTATPTPFGATPLYSIPDEINAVKAQEIPGTPSSRGEGDLPMMRPEDYQYFGKLMEVSDEAEADLSPEEAKEHEIMKLLLKIKNGTPPMRKTALRTITEKARYFGAGPLCNQILPLMMSSTLEDQERHLLVKVIDRILYKLDDLIRPYVHKILVVIEPLLIDEDYYARVEGREIISNLAKAAGLATMIATMRPDIDHQDEYVRNTTARAFAVVASALGIPCIIPFLKAVCGSTKSWQARHTGIKIVQQIAILMGCAVLPHLKPLVDTILLGLTDEQQKVRTITALALAALAEAATPYGIEAFDAALKPLWRGICEHRGKGLAAFLKAIGYIIPLMDAEHANYFTREVMVILIREFQTPDEEMKKIVLKVVKQCVATEGVEAQYIREEILPHFFKNFWVVRMALDKRNYRQLVDTTVEIANKVGGSEIVTRVVEDLKDPSEPYRKMVVETIEKVLTNLGVADIDVRLEEQLIDGIVYAFQEQSSEDTKVMLDGFGTIVNCLGKRVKPYLPQICGMIRWRLNTPSAKVRQQAADVVARIAVVMKHCGEEQMLGHLGLYLYEYLGEEYPEVLGSILGALKAIVNVVGMQKMSPPIKDLLPRLTPILKNRHEKVQENCIDLVGRIADRGAELVSTKEWDRICFDLLELLKAHKKAIRRATVNTFGYIAKAVGPQDVITTLLNNLRVQERQLRVCTTVAIAIVAETCGPYTVLPHLMNEYRVHELNVQNGVLKSLCFMFEYIGELGKDYIYPICGLLEDALLDRDLVHRQTASWTCKHLALGVHGLSREDALIHLMNHVWPNIFETSPHLIQAVIDAVDGFRVSIGPGIVLQYLLQGLWHPARKVRETYWRLYNNVYMGHQDALVSFYPNVPPEPNNDYTRHELCVLL